MDREATTASHACIDRKGIDPAAPDLMELSFKANPKPAGAATSSRVHWPQVLYLIIELPAIWDFKVPLGDGPSGRKADILAEQPIPVTWRSCMAALLMMLRTILTIIDTEFYSDEEDSDLRKTNSSTPDLFAFDCGQLPFERMGADHFELLLADLYSAQADAGREDWYDKARRLNDGADQGRDVILTLDSAPVGVIQCKRYIGIVSLDMIIKEICKFFLYATIKPGIASASGEPFRYYVAVSDRAAGKLFEFLEAKGRQRFDDLRAEFEEGALLVRKGSATLRKHPALKSLTKEQLCDLVWARIDNLQTALHKKDDLSRMVGAYPGIRSTYFRLEQASADIVGEVKAFLQSRNLVVSDEDQKLIADIRTEYIKLRLGRHHRFQSALVQGEELMPFMRGMLQHKAGTLFDQFGSHPVVLTAGAQAATPTDWDELNQLVDAYASPVVVFVGCGDVSGAQLNEW
ncbi:hypothetical protein Tco_1414785, partial [Tanacetum coccineum]